MLNYKDYISDKDRDLSIVCHRTLWGKYPENSISGIKNAIDKNFSIVEIDVRRNIDGDFFVIHDEDLERTTNLSGRISCTSSNIIKNAFLKKSNGNNNRITDEKIPSLLEVLNLFKGNVLFDIDVKNPSDRKALLSFIHDNDFHNYVDVKKPLKTASEAKKYIKERHESKIINMIVLNITNQSLEEICEVIDITDPQIVEINFDDISIFEKVSNFCLKKSASVWVNTLDDVPNGGFTDKLALSSPDACWGSLISKGVSLIQTDYPETLKDWYKSKI